MTRARSQELLDWAEVIICEWCTNNAIWYSQRKRPGQMLIVRLHRFELYGQYVKKLNFDAVDRMVFVGDFYRDEAVARLEWPSDRLTVIPNWVDTRQLDRPKTPDAHLQPRHDRCGPHAQADGPRPERSSRSCAPWTTASSSTSRAR